MRIAMGIGLVVLPVLAACETFEPYSVEYEEIIQEQGVSVYSNLMEDISGDRWLQFSASNASGADACVQIRIVDGSTSGHRMGDVYRLASGETVDIGYVDLPAQLNTNTQVWQPQADGNCGYAPG